jgi:hypothetical protein
MHPGNTEHLIGIIFAKRNVVFRHAGHHTCAATGAFVQINYHSKLVGIFVFHQHPLAMTIFYFLLSIDL